MKKIVLIASACALLVGLDRLSIAVYKNVVMADDTPMRTERQFEQFPGRIDYLIVGDSHLQHGLDTFVLERSFNYTVAAESYIQSYYKLRHVIRQGQKEIGTVILNADPHSFTARRSDYLPMPYNYYYAEFVDYGELGRRKGRLGRYLAEGVSGRFFPFAGCRLDLANALQEKKLTPLQNGFVAGRRNFAAMDQAVVTAARTFQQFSQTDCFDADLFVYFNKIIRLCLDNRIGIVVVQMPLSRIYLKYAARYVDVGKLNRRIARETGRFPRARLLDGQSMFVDRPQFFHDCDHLNKSGAARLTARIREALSRTTPMSAVTVLEE